MPLLTPSPHLAHNTRTAPRFCNAQQRKDYSATQEKLAAVTVQHQSSSDNVSNLTSELQSLSEQLSEIKEHMDNRGDTMTDTSPLVQIKKALQTVKEEIKTFELRIGVVGHTLMQAKLRNAMNHQGGARSARVAAGDDGGDFEMSEDEDF